MELECEAAASGLSTVMDSLGPEIGMSNFPESVAPDSILRNPRHFNEKKLLNPTETSTNA